MTWGNQAEKDGAPISVIVALTHRQFVTIQPYYDGNLEMVVERLA